MSKPQLEEELSKVLDLNGKITWCKKELESFVKERDEVLGKIITELTKAAETAIEEFNEGVTIKVILHSPDGVSFCSSDSVILKVKIFGKYGEFNEEFNNSRELHDLITVKLQPIFNKIVAPILAVTLDRVTVSPYYYIK